MKDFAIPAAVLAALLALTIWNARAVRAETDDWRMLVADAREAARNGDMAAAAERVAELGERWQARRTYYHIILEHSELNDVEELLSRAGSALARSDGDGFDIEAAALDAQLCVLAEMQGISVGNIL